MGDTAIQWTDKSWNPVVGCTKVSAGCKLCYAKTLHDQRHKAYHEGKAVPAQYAKPFEELQLMPERLRDPLTWKKPQRVFVNSVSDLFHEDIPFDFIDRVFAVMAVARRHTFQILTKRPERMTEYLRWEGHEEAAQEERRNCNCRQCCIAGHMDQHLASIGCDRATAAMAPSIYLWKNWPLPNVWLGTSVENQAAADDRIPHLLATPAAVRFLSCEPLLGEVNLAPYLGDAHEKYQNFSSPVGINWVICGGESGAGSRPMAVEWARELVRQCQVASVACFVKQMGGNVEFNGMSNPGEHWPNGVKKQSLMGRFRVLLADKKGGDPSEWPEDLRVRDFPTVS